MSKILCASEAAVFRAMREYACLFHMNPPSKRCLTNQLVQDACWETQGEKVYTVSGLDSAMGCFLHGLPRVRRLIPRPYEQFLL